MKICSYCFETKPDEEFSFKNRRTGLRQSVCKPCNRLYQQLHYQDHKADYKRKARVRNDRVIEQRRAFVYKYLLEHPCVDCGESDPVVLEFDHRDPSAKIAGVARLCDNATSEQKIMEEIEKCDVRCCNCHRRRTARQFGWHDKKSFQNSS